MSNDTCIFDIAYVGPCGKPTGEWIYGLGPNRFCPKHEAETCRCGAQAVRQCDATYGPAVCGEPRCERCGCSMGGR